MGETTTLALNAPKKASLRTTIPMFIVRQWGLKPGDKLDWSLEARKNEMIILVRKTENSNNKNKKKKE
jgi:bifunctional DNA-binding transcriptional regulator/antitoxin component of YhaV-PrlF toxin-antitoxin module